MSIQFLGMIGHRLSSETIAPVGPIFDRDYIVRFAQTHEAAGFDRLLVGHWSDQPDGFLVTALAGLSTQKIQYLLAHRPGFVSPTLAARKFATLEHLLGGRLAVHIISGGNDAEQRRDGDYLDHDQRYARTDAFLDVVRQVWTSEQPVDIHNEFYQAEQAWSAIRPLQKPHLPIYFGGSSAAAIAVAGKHADVFALWGESLAQTGETIQRVRAEAAKHQRDIGFSVSFRPIIADSEAEAWEKAEHILHVATEQAAQRGAVSRPNRTASAPSGCGPPPRRAEWWTNACGPASPSWWAAGITLPPWWAPRSRWPMRCSITTTSGCATS